MKSFERAKAQIWQWYENLGDRKRSFLLVERDSYLFLTELRDRMTCSFSLYESGSVHLIKNDVMTKEQAEDFRKLQKIFRDYLSDFLEETEHADKRPL